MGFRRLDSVDPEAAAKCLAAVRSLAVEPRPAAASALGRSGYYRLAVDNWRLLFFPDDVRSAVHIWNVGRVPDLL
jgi:mRNA interferase RelE/StbE